MKYPVTENKALKESLRKAYLEKEALDVDDRWRLGTMPRIRAMGPLKARADFWLGLEQIAWRLSPVTCALILLCALAFLGSDTFHDYEVLSVFTADPEDLSLFQLFGFGA